MFERSMTRRIRTLYGALFVALWDLSSNSAATLAARQMTTEALREHCIAGKYAPSAGRFRGTTFDFLLFKPQYVDAAKRYPLIVWLHGYGDYEFNPMGQIKHFGLLLTSEEEVQCARFYLLAVQCPSDPGMWFAEGGEKGAGFPDDPGDVVIEILEEVAKSHRVDPDRVTLVGISGGGNSCWEMVARNPGRFAAVAPLSGAAGAPASAPLFKDIPVWAFHNASDYLSPVEPVRRFIKEIQQAGGSAYLTEPPGADHNSWQPAFEHYDLLNWLLSQRQGMWIKLKPPGYKPWSHWQIVAQVGFPAVLLAAWRSERRRRLRKLELPDRSPPIQASQRRKDA